MFTSRFFVPKEIKLKVISSQTQFNVNTSNLEKYSSPIGINFVSGRERCVWEEGNCTIGKMQEIPLKYYLLNYYLYLPILPIEMTLSPKEPYMPINLSIDYADVTSLSDK